MVRRGSRRVKTIQDVIEWARDLGDDQDVDGAREAFRIVYGRDPRATDGNYLDLVSHVCAGLPDDSEGE